MRLQLSWVAQVVNAAWAPSDGAVDVIVGAGIDSRVDLSGRLFVAVQAARDGHEFVADAVRHGAVAALVSTGRAATLRPQVDAVTQETGRAPVALLEVPDPVLALQTLAAAVRAQFDVPVVAITGSNGKTTTRGMIEAALVAGGLRVLATQGNLNNHLGLPLSLINGVEDPDAIVVELGMSAPGENELLARICRPTVAVTTSVGIEHLEYMRTIEAIARAESEVAWQLADDGCWILPGDEPLLQAQLAEVIERAERDGRALTVVPTIAGAGAQVRVEQVQAGPPTRGGLSTPEGVFNVQLRVFGAHNLRNAAMALSVARAVGVETSRALEGLAAFEPVGDRGRVVMVGAHAVIADCYNANPGSVEVALRSLVAADQPLRVAVLGDMLELGDTERALHEQVGSLCAQLGVHAVFTLGERARWIAQAAEAAGTPAQALDSVEALASRLRAKMRDASEAGQAMVVLVKGSRGARMERVITRLLDDVT